MNSKWRLTVVILAVAAGFVLQRYVGIEGGMVFGLLGGLILAQFLPSRQACGLPAPGADERH